MSSGRDRACAARSKDAVCNVNLQGLVTELKIRYFVVIFLICLLAAGAFVFVRGRVQGRESTAGNESDRKQGAVVCVYYADTFLSIDNDGIVCGNSSQKPEGQILTDGIDFLKLTYGKKAQTVEAGALDYVLKVASCLQKHDIQADRLSYADRMVNIYIGGLEIQLGKNDKTEDKINDLSNFLDKIPGGSGTLYMQNANANNYGYTFRAK